MSAFTRLWKRAPFWRTALLLGGVCTGLTAFFPTASLKHHAPWLPGHALPSSAVDTNANSPPQPTSDTGKIGLPDPNIIQRGAIHIAGHTIPLPTGDWHPILTGQDGPRGELSEQFLARMDRGVITGIIVARATQIPIPASAVLGLDTPCHDDRNYYAHISEKAAPSGLPVEECTFTSNAVLDALATNAAPFEQAAFDRLRTLAYPVPPIMMNIGWFHVAPVANAQSVQAESIITLIAPLDPQTNQIIAPPQAWPKENLSKFPQAKQFVSATNTWAKTWTNLLMMGFARNLTTADITPTALDDPANPNRRGG